jgi:hypothetical protein
MAKTKSASSAKGGSRSPRPRNVVAAILLVVILGALAFELKAGRDLATASDAVDRFMAAHHHKDMPRPEVEALIGRRPDGPPTRVGMESEVTYTWQGVRPHVLKLYFLEAESGPATLVRMEVK